MIARVVAVSMFLCLAGFNAVAQMTLPDLVREARADWMLGRWEAETDSGQTVSLNITWELEKHAISFHVKGGDMEARSFSVKDPSADEVKYFAFDNRGTITKGTWALEGDELVLRTETQLPDNVTRSAAIVFTGSASEGLKVRMHGVDSSGSLATPARMTISLKKKG